jgi:hypothetical protein
MFYPPQYPLKRNGKGPGHGDRAFFCMKISILTLLPEYRHPFMAKIPDGGGIIETGKNQK